MALHVILIRHVNMIVSESSLLTTINITMTNFKFKIIRMLIIVTAMIAIALSTIYINRSVRCQDIIGDGYAMGIDPKPVVIGNTCD